MTPDPNQPPNAPSPSPSPTEPDPHPRTVEAPQTRVERSTTYEITQYVFGAWRTVTLLIRRLNGRINLWAESEDDAVQPRGLCEEHEALVFDPDLDGLEIGNQQVIGLMLPSEMFAKIQSDIRDIQSDDLDPRNSPARLHGGMDESHSDELAESDTDTAAFEDNGGNLQ